MKIIINCRQCGKDFKATPARYFCSRKCYYKSRKGVESPVLFWIKATEKQKLARLKINFNKHVIQKEDGCWDWKNCIMNNGYTTIYFGEKLLLGHRASWMLHHGKIPDGLFVLHKCDNRKCTNPEHLFLGTAKDNVHDMIKKGRKKQSPGLSGEKNPTSKLTHNEVCEIRRLLDSSCTQSSLARKFHVTRSAIWCIKNNKCWRSVDGAIV